MNIIERFQKQSEKLILAVGRYPLAFAFILSLTLANFMTIADNGLDFYNYSFTFVVGIALSLVAERVYRRFFFQIKVRLIFNLAALVLALLYLFLQNWPAYISVTISIRTTVILLMSTLAFIWLPTIQSSLRFTQNFVMIIKFIFITILYTLVLAIGISLILTITNLLLFNVGFSVYPHIINVVGSLFAPSFFLSMLPAYISKRDEGLSREKQRSKREQLEDATVIGTMFKNLISYIIVPLTTIYTFIILIYILINITGDLWTETLLEPLLVSFTVTVLVVYLMTQEVDTKLANTFSRFYPKLLLPIVLFQTIASIIRITDTGLTYGRYFAIIFGVFGVVMATLYGFLSKAKIGWIAPIFIVFGLISITPPLDAFSVSFYSQSAHLEDILEDNDMLEADEIIPREDLDRDERIRITDIVNYFDNTDQLRRIDYLPNNIFQGNRFETVFGFSPTYGAYDYGQSQLFSMYLMNREGLSLSISEYDALVTDNFSANQSNLSIQIDENFEIRRSGNRDSFSYQFVEADEVIFEVSSDMLIEELEAFVEDDEGVTQEEATVSFSNARINVTFVVNQLSIYSNDYYADVLILMEILD